MVKSQACHRQLTVKAGDSMEEVTVKAVLTVFTSNAIRE